MKLPSQRTFMEFKEMKRYYFGRRVLKVFYNTAEWLSPLLLLVCEINIQGGPMINKFPILFDFLIDQIFFKFDLLIHKRIGDKSTEHPEIHRIEFFDTSKLHCSLLHRFFSSHSQY